MADLRLLTLADLQVGLRDLFENRRDQLRRSAAGRLYEPLLEGRLKSINTLPGGEATNLPVADELHRVDDMHDAIGASVYFTTEAYLKTPLVPEDLRQAAQRIRDAFIPRLSELSLPFAEEAARARSRRQLVPEFTNDLKRIPVYGGGTLLDWVNAFIEQGERIEGLLSTHRTTVTEDAAANRAEARQLRAGTIGVLTRVRVALADELGANPDLPRDLDGIVLGYFDQLAEVRAEGQSKA